MSALLWRVIFAVIACVLIYALIPPVSHVIGFSIDGDLFTIVKVCIAGLALLYILRGPAPFPGP